MDDPLSTWLEDLQRQSRANAQRDTIILDDEAATRVIEQVKKLERLIDGHLITIDFLTGKLP